MKQVVNLLLALTGTLGAVAQPQSVMETNKKAPLQFHHEVFINATPERVWTVLADMEHWPTWNTDITYLTLKGDLKPGTQFVWKEKGATPTSYLQSVLPNQQLGWTGRAMGMRAVHIFTLIPQDGGTLVVQEESLEGWLVIVLKPIVRRLGNSGMAHWNEALKQRVEAVAGRTPAQ